jgi:hypothetical protein
MSLEKAGEKSRKATPQKEELRGVLNQGLKGRNVFVDWCRCLLPAPHAYSLAEEEQREQISADGD